MLKLVETSETQPEAPRSQTSAAYARLRADILAGRFAPGDKLKIADLSTALAVNSSATREALSRLVADQLVVSRDQRGFVVAPLSIADLEDLTEIRCEIEAVALRRSIARGGDDWEGALLGAAHRLRRTPMKSAQDASLTGEWVARHAAFHAALVAACGSRRLLKIHAQLYEQSERYRGLSVHVEGHRNVEGEHDALVDAALDRDADQLVELTLAHFRLTTSLIIDAVRRCSASASART